MMQIEEPLATIIAGTNLIVIVYQSLVILKAGKSFYWMFCFQ